MGRYSDFTLLWKSWGGYPDRDHAFGVPTVICVTAKGDEGDCCCVRREPVSATGVETVATWKAVPPEMISNLRRALNEADVFDSSVPLVESNANGDYVVSWELTGADAGRTFDFCVEFTCPGEAWTAAGDRLSESLHTLERLTAISRS